METNGDISEENTKLTTQDTELASSNVESVDEGDKRRGVRI